MSYHASERTHTEISLILHYMEKKSKHQGQIWAERKKYASLHVRKQMLVCFCIYVAR